MNHSVLFYIKHPAIIADNVWRRISPIIPDKLYLSVLYRINFGYWMNFKKPLSFNEKLQWLKLYDRKPEYIKMVDKYEAKKYVASLIGEEHIIPTYGVWSEYRDINFHKLPNQFVLKCTHDSGGVVICKDKSSFNYLSAKNKLTKSLKKKYFWEGREWPYKFVKPQIIAEKFLSSLSNNNTDNNKDYESRNPGETKEIMDYKFFCFNGKVEFFKIDIDRFQAHKANYYDLDFNLLPFREKALPNFKDYQLELPDNFHEMIRYAERIANGIKFARIDFYDVDEHIYFGEITFYPAAGLGQFVPNKYDLEIGNKLSIV